VYIIIRKDRNHHQPRRMSMIISKKYAQRLVREGKARIEGRTTTGPYWGCDTGEVYVIVTRLDKQDTDHYKED
jgi:hypothetical protein